MIMFGKVLLFTFIAIVYAYRPYKEQIPNGNLVIDPCNSKNNWPGVGHRNPSGGGERNNFGNDFKANNYIWNESLCKRDSDGDGLTNGEELGDPQCTWFFSSSNPQTPRRLTNITHPGICEPLNSDICKNEQPCQQTPCAATKDSNVKSIQLQFPRTNIPQQVTTYRCLQFELPSDNIYDVVVISPVVDNPDVTHHMVLYGCSSVINSITNKEPFDCPMGGSDGCTGNIVVWTKGFGDNCLPPEYGYRIGRRPDGSESGIRFVVLQIHWTNDELKIDLYDASGLKLYYTPVLRPNRADILQIVQNDLFIPPKQYIHRESAICDSFCTNSGLAKPVNITQGFVHMHLLGKYGSIIQRRNGKYLRDIIKPHAYNYNSPEFFILPNPIELRPGDEIEVNCEFDSAKRNHSTRFGPSTSDEMCVAILIYYPAQLRPFQDCGEVSHAKYCQDGLAPVSTCNLTSIGGVLQTIDSVCKKERCNADCASQVNLLKATGCLQSIDGYHLLAADNAARVDLIDACLLSALPNCEMRVAEDTMAKMAQHCDYTCDQECRALNRLLKSTGCMQTETWRRLNRTNEDLAFTIQSCDRLDTDLPFSASEHLIPLFALVAAMSAAMYCIKASL